MGPRRIDGVFDSDRQTDSLSCLVTILLLGHVKFVRTISTGPMDALLPQLGLYSHPLSGYTRNVRGIEPPLVAKSTRPTCVIYKARVGPAVQ